MLPSPEKLPGIRSTGTDDCWLSAMANRNLKVGVKNFFFW